MFRQLPKLQAYVLKILLRFFEKILSAIFLSQACDFSRVGLRENSCWARRTFVYSKKQSTVGADRCVCPKMKFRPFGLRVSVVVRNILNHCMLSTDTPVA